MFRTVPLSIIRSFSLYTQQYIHVWWHLAVSKPVWHIPLLRVQWKYPDDGQRNCKKHIEFYSKKIWEISASSWFCYKNNLSLYLVKSLKTKEEKLESIFLCGASLYPKDRYFIQRSPGFTRLSFWSEYY